MRNTILCTPSTETKTFSLVYLDNPTQYKRKAQVMSNTVLIILKEINIKNVILSF